MVVNRNDVVLLSVLLGLLAVASAARARDPVARDDIAPGVWLIDHGDTAIGVVALGDDALVIDGWLDREALASAGISRRARYAIALDDTKVQRVANTAGGAVIVQPNDQRPTPNAAIRFEDRTRLALGARIVELRSLGSARDSGQLVAWVPDARVLFVGSLLSTGDTDTRDIADLDGWIDALGSFERLAPRVVIGSRGRRYVGDALKGERERLVAMRDVIRDGIARRQDAATIDARVAERVDTTAAIRRAAYRAVSGLAPPSRLIERWGLRAARSKVAGPAPKKIVVRASDAWLARLERVAPAVELVRVESEAEALEAIADADALIAFVTPALLERGKKLRWIQVGSAGVARYVAMPGLKGSDIVLTNAQRLYGIEIAEHVVAMALALARGLDRSIPLQPSGEWNRGLFSGDGPAVVELRSKTLLVVGLGGIGTEVARIASGLGMKVIATRGSRREGPEFVAYIGLADETLALAGRADVVVNCTPLTPQTTSLFDAKFFRAMRKTATFINIGRGASVVTKDLVAALEAKQIAGCGLDVTDPEPLPKDHALWRMPNVIITPHVSAGSDVRRERLLVLWRENLRRFANGEPLLSVVDKVRGY